MTVDVLIDHNDFSIKRPIKIHIKKDSNGELVGHIPKLEIVCYGNSVYDIKIDAGNEIIELFKDIAHLSDSKLGKFPKMWKRFMKNRITKSKSTH